MGDLTTYAMNKIIDRFFRNQAFTPPTTMYIGLHKSDPGVAGSDANELAKTGYTRQAVTLSAGSSGLSANTNKLIFGPAGEAWDEVTYFALHDNPTAGNQWMNDALPTPRTVANGESAEIAIGDVDISFALQDSTTYLMNKIIDHCFRNQAYTPAATMYAGLHTADPGVTGSDSNELSGNGYTRESVAFSSPSGGVTANSGIVTFGPATTSGWTAVTYAAIHDAETVGNQLINDALANSRTVALGESAQFAVGDLDLSFS